MKVKRNAKRFYGWQPEERALSRRPKRRGDVDALVAKK